MIQFQPQSRLQALEPGSNSSPLTCLGRNCLSCTVRCNPALSGCIPGKAESAVLPGSRLSAVWDGMLLLQLLSSSWVVPHSTRPEKYALKLGSKVEEWEQEALAEFFLGGLAPCLRCTPLPSFCRALCVPNVAPTLLEKAVGLERVKKDQEG